MKKLTLLFVLAFIIQTSVLSQGCLPDGILFETQAQIDSFQINYPNCTEIEGHARIWGNDITNLTGLNVLTSIGSNLQINDNTSLTDLTGLESLTIINGGLHIINNSYLTSLLGLNNLASIEGDLAIIENDTLINLAELSSLSYLGGDLTIYGNASLVSLTGLEGLTNVIENLNIGIIMFDPYGNPSLTNLTGLDNLTSVGGFLEINANFNLSSLTGLENLEYVGGDFVLISNSTLTDISSLVTLNSIGGAISINYNHALVTLSGLDNINAATIDNLIIYNNFLLATCDVQSICDYLVSPGGTVGIQDNATGCNSQEEVEEACDASGILDNNFRPEFSIYPNPATDKLFITSNNGLKIETVNIYNQLGQIIFHRNEPIGEIDISTLGQGIYIIELTSNELKTRQKLIIEK